MATAKIESVYAAAGLAAATTRRAVSLLHPLDETFARNSLLAELKLDSYEKQMERHEFSGMPEHSLRLCGGAWEGSMTPSPSAICLTRGSWAA